MALYLRSPLVFQSKETAAIFLHQIDPSGTECYLIFMRIMLKKTKMAPCHVNENALYMPLKAAAH